jgi:aspartate 1-decarboxylase
MQSNDGLHQTIPRLMVESCCPRVYTHDIRQAWAFGMLRRICKGKIHRAWVTQADLSYVGSITIDRKLMEAADIRPFEMVQITNVSNGVMWHTYAMVGESGSGVICLNGPPARHFQVGDGVIILSLGWADDREWRSLTPNVVFVDQSNQITSVVPHPLQNEAAIASPMETDI